MCGRRRTRPSARSERSPRVSPSTPPAASTGRGSRHSRYFWRPGRPSPCWAHREWASRPSSTDCWDVSSNESARCARVTAGAAIQPCIESCSSAPRAASLSIRQVCGNSSPGDAARALEDAFEEIQQLGAGCRFRDCQHLTEPRCAVRKAVEDGQLAAARLEHFHKLRAERAFLNQRRDELAAMTEKRRTKVAHRAITAPSQRPKRSGPT